MVKYTNPFYTLCDTMAILRHCGSTDNTWATKILSVNCSRVYENGSHHFKVEIHLSEEGFKELAALAEEHKDFLWSVQPHSDWYDMQTIEPSPLLTLYTLVPKVPNSQEVQP